MQSSQSTRFTPQAAEKMRQSIQKAGGVEIFAIGKMDTNGLVSSIEVHCRGNKHAVPALLTRPRTGEVVIHNHPSGILEASEADMHLANLYGEDGVGVIIVNNQVNRALWVVEPHTKSFNLIKDADIIRFFEQDLPRLIPDIEHRQSQIDMALSIADSFNTGKIAILEAGTGTGKSLAYLLPAVLWATQNNTKVAIATFTINLQSQLISSDIPLLMNAGLHFDYALLKGRNNYICRRRFMENRKQQPKDQSLQAIHKYIQSTQEGSRSDIGFPISDEIWDNIGSDHDQTLRARCPHYEDCFYYNARREAAKSHLLIVNHHLLMADMLVKKETGADGILPRFNRVVIDEGHHLEDAATSLFRQQISTRAIRRAISPLIHNKKRPGTLERLVHYHLAPEGGMDLPTREVGINLVDELEATLPKIWNISEVWLQQIASDVLSPEVSSFRIKPEFSKNILWEKSIDPILLTAAKQVGIIADKIAKLETLFEDLPEQARTKEPQPLLDLQRARRRLTGHSGFLQLFRLIGSTEEPQLDTVRWVEKARGKHKVPTATLCLAPVEVGPTLREQLFLKLKAIATCSATMTVNNEFDHYKKRVGLSKPHPTLSIDEQIFPSPFDYQQQAILGIPTDLAHPSSKEFTQSVGNFINQAIKVSSGGVFVLCTSYSMLYRLHNSAQKALGSKFNIFRQGQMGRVQLMQRFLQSPNSVLFGADSFWEGVSVKGDDLRMVIIPKLPFRVPTEPVQQARHERLEAHGLNPFTHYSLPQAALRLRQGFGRLIRTQSDKGVVLILDSRINKRWYGKIFLNSLPDLERIIAPASTILQRIPAFLTPNTPQLQWHRW